MHMHVYTFTGTYTGTSACVYVHVHCNHVYSACTKTLQVMETTHHIYLVTEYASKGEIFGKTMYMHKPISFTVCPF